MMSVEELTAALPAPIRAVRTVRLDWHGSSIDLASRFADQEGTVVLLSGGSSDEARYDVIGAMPWLTVRERNGRLAATWNGGSVEADVDPLAALDAVMRKYALPDELAPIVPLPAGLLGYFAYDLKDAIEVLPQASDDDLQLPRMYLTAPAMLLVRDRREGTTVVHLPVFDDGEGGVERRLSELSAALSAPPPPRSRKLSVGKLHSGLSRERYIEAVEKVRDYIVAGDVYQVNISQRFEVPIEGDAFALFSSLFEANPAPFFAYIEAGDHQIVSTSPERFLKLDRRIVETRPIKGTRPRGTTEAADQALRYELLTSKKDDAELSMIVDLLRNDLGKVCATDSVHVAEHKRLEVYTNVFHLVSVVRGVLDIEKTTVDLFRAAFPCGSITGCPKIRSMEIIDEIEPVRRHVYTGSIGYMGFAGTMDLSVAIRTAIIRNGRLYFAVGGGVVFDSNAADEHEETLHKGRTLTNLLSQLGKPQ